MYGGKHSNEKTVEEQEHAGTTTSVGTPSSNQATLKITQSCPSDHEREIAQLELDLEKERARKRKLYSSVLKLSDELKQLKETSASLFEAAEYAGRTWYDGGLWRSPQLLPDVLRNSLTGRNDGSIIREPVSLTDLFLDLICVTAFSRVGDAIKGLGTVNGPILAIFAVFWLIWVKEASYSTRFDTTDLSSQIETLLTCFAVLFGSLSATNDFDDEDATRIMMVAAFVAILHFCLHARVAYLYRNAEYETDGYFAKKYAVFIMVMTILEAIVWIVGITAVPPTSSRRAIIYLFGILLSLRVPKAFIANDFHAASSKRGVLFILLLGYALQGIVLVAGPFFDFMTPSAEQYTFLGAICFILFCIKLLYVDDTYSIEPKDHALLVNRFAGFFFNIGQFLLLLSTTVLWAGLDLLTHSYFAGSGALSNNARGLVSGGYAAVIFSILFIKSMHIRRIPLNPLHEKLFYITYCLQLVIYVAIITFSICLCVSNSHLSFLTVDHKQMVFVLAAASLLLVLVSWMDEAIEATLYGSSAEEHRVQPFGFWTFMIQDDDDVLPVDEAEFNSLMRSPSHESQYNTMRLSSGHLVPGSPAKITN